MLPVIEYSYPNKRKQLFQKNFFRRKNTGNNFLLIRIYDIGVCTLIFDTDKILTARGIYQDFAT